jgi:hypothetical protein
MAQAHLTDEQFAALFEQSHVVDRNEVAGLLIP